MCAGARSPRTSGRFPSGAAHSPEPRHAVRQVQRSAATAACPRGTAGCRRVRRCCSCRWNMAIQWVGGRLAGVGSWVGGLVGVCRLSHAATARWAATRRLQTPVLGAPVEARRACQRPRVVGSVNHADEAAPRSEQRNHAGGVAHADVWLVQARRERVWRACGRYGGDAAYGGHVPVVAEGNE